MQKKLLSFKVLFFSLITAITYILLTIYITNNRLINDTVLGQYPLSYKVNILWLLFVSLPETTSSLNLLLLITTALLTGLTIVLVIKRINTMKKVGGISGLTFSGSSIGVIGSGCAACGLPILGVLGIASSAAYLPLHGTEIAIFSVVILSISLCVLLRNSKIQEKCDIKGKSRN